MDKPIRFTRHAQQKFIDLAYAGFAVTPEQVIDTIRHAEYIDVSSDPPIAQRAISERHLLRVVFVEDEREIRIVTFYPSRRNRYEPEDAI